MIRTVTSPLSNQHTPITKVDLTDHGRPANSEPDTYQWTSEQIDAYLKDKYPNLRPPTNSHGQKQSKPVGGFSSKEKDDKRQKGRKQPC